MSSNWRIRPAEPGDAPALVALGRAVGSEPGRWLITASDWRSVGDERRYLKAVRRYPHAAVFVAEDTLHQRARVDVRLWERSCEPLGDGQLPGGAAVVPVAPERDE